MYSLLLSYINKTWIFATDFRKILKHKITGKSAQWKISCFMRTDGQTGKTKTTVTFRNFANSPKKRRRRRSRMCEWQTVTSWHLETELKRTNTAVRWRPNKSFIDIINTKDAWGYKRAQIVTLLQARIGFTCLHHFASNDWKKLYLGLWQGLVQDRQTVARQ